MLQPRIGFWRQHHRGGTGQSRQPRQGLVQRRLDRLRLAYGGKLALDRRTLILREVADLHQGIDEKRKPSSVGSRPAEVWGA